MNQKQFIKRLGEMHDECTEISSKKNSDYATDEDPFKNFRVCEMLGVDSNEGILVRMTDKMMRAANIIRNGEAKVKEESVMDTLKDLSNYALILAVKLEHEQR